MSVNIFAGIVDKASAKVNYADSIRHNNTLYTENEANNLINYLKALRKTSSIDSLRRYCAEGMLNYSWYLINQGEWFLCGDLLNNARRYSTTKDQSLIHQIETAIAGINLYNENYEEAGALLLKANKYFREHADTEEWLKNCVNLGLYYSRTHNKTKALEYYMKVLDMAQKEKKYENYYSIVSGYAERVEEDSIIGLRILEKALRISNDDGYTFLLPSNYNELASYYYRMENYHEALANARKALNYAEHFSQETMQTKACGTMADVYYIQKNYVAAYEMMARKNSIRDKLQENIGRRYFEHLSKVDSLISWVSANVPAPESNAKGIENQSNKVHNFTWIWILLTCALMLPAGIAIGMRLKHREVVTSDEMTSTENKEDNDISAINHDETVKILTADQLQQAAELNMVTESFNPILDRIRNMVKDIPKSGDSNIDSKVRTLLNYLIQTRLPDINNNLAQTVKEEEIKFTQRLSNAYPTLTKNDLRMAIYIRCGLSLQEISALSGLQAKSVNQARYRLRKSLGLGQEDSLENFILAF